MNRYRRLIVATYRHGASNDGTQFEHQLVSLLSLAERNVNVELRGNYHYSYKYRPDVEMRVASNLGKAVTIVHGMDPDETQE